MTDESTASSDPLIGGLHWFKHLVFGEFDEDRPLSVIVATMLVSFTPGAVIVISARDLCAILVRLAKHPEKREEIEEWILLVACVVPLALPVLAAAVGAAAAGVGAVIGGIAGSEVGAILRGVCLMLLTKSRPALEIVVARLRVFVKGDILGVLRDIRFVNYQKAITKIVGDAIQWLIKTLREIREHLQKLPGFDTLQEVTRRLAALERAFYDVQRSALKWIPLALAELDVRLGRLVQELLFPTPRMAEVGIAAPNALATASDPKRVRSKLGNVPGGRPGKKAPAAVAPPVAAPPNLHPETLKKPSTFAKDIERAKALKNWGGLSTADRRLLLDGEPIIYRNFYGSRESQRVLHLKGATLISGSVDPEYLDVNPFIARSQLLGRVLGVEKVELFASTASLLRKNGAIENLERRGFVMGESPPYRLTDDLPRVTYRLSLDPWASASPTPELLASEYYFHITDRSALPGIRKLGLAPGKVLETGSGSAEDVVLFGTSETKNGLFADGFNTMDFVHVQDPVVIRVPYIVLERDFRFALLEDSGMASGPFVSPEVIMFHNPELFK